MCLLMIPRTPVANLCPRLSHRVQESSENCCQFDRLIHDFFKITVWSMISSKLPTWFSLNSPYGFFWLRIFNRYQNYFRSILSFRNLASKIQSFILLDFWPYDLSLWSVQKKSTRTFDIGSVSLLSRTNNYLFSCLKRLLGSFCWYFMFCIIFRMFPDI